MAIVLLALTALAGAGLADAQARRLRAARAALSARTPNLVDVRFAQFMGLHHEQALLLAQIVLTGPPSQVAGLAEGVRTQQLLEAGEMRGWLKLWDAPSVPPDRGMYWMLQGNLPLDAPTRHYLLDCQRAPTGMAGLASNAEIQALREAQGPARDALFLTLMRRHHEGGLPMARFAARAAGQAAVRDLAARVVAEQQEEVLAIRMAQARPPATATRHNP